MVDRFYNSRGCRAVRMDQMEGVQIARDSYLCGMRDV
jgi:hypothetical protein